MKTKVIFLSITICFAVALAFYGAPTNQTEIARAAPAACVPGPHSGTITTDQEWCLINSPHILNGGVTVAAGVSLTIEPSVEVLFNPGTSLSVNGALIAQGTDSQKITFTSANTTPQAGDWGTINVSSGSHLRLAYCDIGYGGSGAGNRSVYITASDVQVEHCRVHHGSGVGIWLERDDIAPTFQDVEVDHNGGHALLQTTINQNPSFTNLILHDNGADALVIGYGILNRNLTLDGSPTALNGAPVYYPGGGITAGHTLTVTAGTTLKIASGASLNVDGGATLIAIGTPTLPITFTSQAVTPQRGDWSYIHASGGSRLRLAYCEVGYTGSGAAKRGLWISTSDVEIQNCRIHYAFGDALFVDNNSQVALQNLALLDSGWAGLSIMGGSRVDGKHLTLARNGGGVYVAAGGTLALTNTILAQNTTGVNVVNGGTANLTQTLWDRNVTPIVGTVNETGHLEGNAGFQEDGYHLTRYSAALEQGIDAGVTEDMDGEPRPMPAATPPDLGSDEFPYTLRQDFAVEKVAFDPQWILQPDLVSGQMVGRLRQSYLLRFYYGSPEANPPGLTVTITDTLPVELVFEGESHIPAMYFSRQGQTLTWQTQSPVSLGESGEILITTLYEQPEPGRTLVNRAELSAGELHFDLQASTVAPLFPPLIVSPGNGEICPDPTGNVELHGMAQGGALLRVYENGQEVISTTVAAHGAFVVTYPSIHVGVDPQTIITVKACAPSDPNHCSEPSQPLTLTQQKSFWCPQRSKWEDDVNNQHVVYNFRNASGWFSTQDWRISGIFGFYDTDLTLYGCNCPAWSGTTAPPSSIWVIADGVTYYPIGSYPWYHFDITGGAHTVKFYARCGDNVIDDDGQILIDPDGYVFDINQGFDLLNPTLHAVAGVTVTAYVSMPQWGGWTPWPAQLYNNQVNPQVTDATGYFAFFTPPGHYYLQMDGPQGYQSWRSPVVEVISEVLHINVPLTPWIAPSVYQIMVTPNGPDQTAITITVGSTVEWVSELSGLVTPEAWVQFTVNPVTRLLSLLDPLVSTRGWDSGRLAPGEVYRRQFTRSGVYVYSDGFGHQARVVVSSNKIFLPLTRR